MRRPSTRRLDCCVRPASFPKRHSHEGPRLHRHPGREHRRRAPRHPRPSRTVLRGEAHRRRRGGQAHRMGHSRAPRHGHHRRGRHRQERHQRPRRRPARRHGRPADAGVQHLRPRQPAPRQDARLRPRRPHRHAAGRGAALREEPQLRRHRLPDLPAGRRRRRRRPRDDQGRPVRAVPDGSRVRHAQLAGPQVGTFAVSPAR
jgi:hypothetical protein